MPPIGEAALLDSIVKTKSECEISLPTLDGVVITRCWPLKFCKNVVVPSVAVLTSVL